MIRKVISRVLTEGRSNGAIDIAWNIDGQKSCGGRLMQAGYLLGNIFMTDSELIANLTTTERTSVEALAREHNLPVIEVARLYKVARTGLEEDAKVSTFVPLITQRQVRIRIKEITKGHAKSN